MEGKENWERERGELNAEPQTAQSLERNVGGSVRGQRELDPGALIPYPTFQE
jgi:hypothetical protein